MNLDLRNMVVDSIEVNTPILLSNGLTTTPWATIHFKCSPALVIIQSPRNAKDHDPAGFVKDDLNAKIERIEVLKTENPKNKFMRITLDDDSHIDTPALRTTNEDAYGFNVFRPSTPFMENIPSTGMFPLFHKIRIGNHPPIIAEPEIIPIMQKGNHLNLMAKLVEDRINRSIMPQLHFRLEALISAFKSKTEAFSRLRAWEPWGFLYEP